MSVERKMNVEREAGAWERAGAPVLWASALVLAGMLVMQLGKLGQSASAPDAAEAMPPLALASMAMGDVTAQVGDYSLLSFTAGSEDVLVVLDGRNEQLFAYRVKNQREVELLERAKLPDVFAAARAVGPGRK